GTINAGTNTVTLQQWNAGQPINLGTDLANTLGLLQTDLSGITASLLQIGNAASGAVTVSSPIVLTTAANLTVTNGSDLAVNAAVSDPGAVNFNFGLDGAGHTATLSGAINGTSARVTGGGGNDSITVNTVSSTTPLIIDGAAGSDAYTVNHGGWSGTVTIADSGATAGDAATLFGTAGADTFDVNSTAAQAVLFGSPATERVNYTANLEQLTINGPAFPGDSPPTAPTATDLGDTFRVNPDANTAITI